MLLRYGWGLEPSQVCGLIKGLSPRAYRKEITRGVDELTERMRAVERGSWCSDREPVLKAYAAGLADVDQARQARAHLAHCRPCTEFVGRLGGHLHDVGGAVAATEGIDGIDGHLALGDRLVDLGERAVGLVSRGGSAAAEAGGSQLATAGGARGAGAAGAGILAKLAGIGTAGKIALACAGGGVAATACVAAGVGPLGLSGPGSDPPVSDERPDHRNAPKPGPSQVLSTNTLPSQVDHTWEPPPAAPPAESDPPQGSAVTSEPAESEPAETTEATTPATPTVTTSAAPTEQEFGVGTAAVAPPSSGSSTPPPATSGGAPTESASSVRQEFGP